MKKRKRKINLKNKWWLGLLLLVDIVTKWWMVRVGDYQINWGVSFGMFDDERLNLLLIVVIMILLVIWWWNVRSDGVGEQLFLIGGVGNLVDRVVYGGVIDWLKIPIIDLWFNVADFLIVFGVTMVIVENVILKKMEIREIE